MDYKNELLELMNKLGKNGVFLTAGKEKPNTMTASWGFCGVMWNKPILIIPVRPSRFTHDIIIKNKEFSVSVPVDNSLNKMLAYFGSISGRVVDKYAQQNIVPVKCKNIDTFIMPGNCINFECKLIYQNNIIKERLDDASIDKFYKDNSYHTMFYGEIVTAY